MSDVLEGWSYPVSETVPISGLKILDHTFVKAPNNGPAYFNCFGGHESALAHPLQGASGNGYYAVANCYRLPLPPLPDTSGLGVYATHGVCHQAANRFLWSACGYITGPTIRNAQGYYLSFSLYGTYGRPLLVPPPPAPYPPLPEPPADFAMIYAGCYGKSMLIGETPRTGEQIVASPKGVEQRITALHSQHHAKKKKLDHNAVVDEELRILVGEHLGPDFELAKVREIRNHALGRAHKIATSDLRGRNFAHEINGIAVQYLDEMENHLGPENYSRLLQMNAKERYALVDPELAEKAGTRGTRA